MKSERKERKERKTKKERKMEKGRKGRKEGREGREGRNTTIQKKFSIIIKLNCVSHFLVSTHLPGAMLTPPLLLWVLRLMASAWWVCVGCSESPASWVLPGEEQGVMLIVSSSSLKDPLGVMFRCLLSCFYTLRWNLRYIWLCYLWCLFCMLDTISFSFVIPETCSVLL